MWRCTVTSLAITVVLVGMAVCQMPDSRGLGDETSVSNTDLPIVSEDADSDANSSSDIPRSSGKTLGGMQFWGDVVYFRGYRIQHNVVFGKYRLLDEDNRRFGSGTREECETALAKIRRAKNLKPDAGHAVIYLHGIGRTSRSMAPIVKGMPNDGYVHVLFEYPSTRVPIEKCSEYLHSVVESLTDVSEISFVTHSMGGLVVRRYLRDHADPRLRQLVMLGTPNSGSEMADMLRSNFVFKAVLGPAGQELVTDPQGTIKSLPTPTIPFGVIAGGAGNEKGYNPLLPGDDDGTVTVASARLPGAVDFLRVPRLHAFLMSDETAIAAVRHFIEHGRFSAERDPEPIPAGKPNDQSPPK
jgi:pimeloyl-ACP methyl ester carboxylesterase